MSPIKELGNVYYFEVTIEKNEEPMYVPESDPSSRDSSRDWYFC
jgi:hypothetical protein